MIILFATIAILMMILIPVGLAIALRRRYSVPWWLFCLGMLTFAGSQIVHFPLNNLLPDLGLIGHISADAPHLLRTSLVLGLSAGVSESATRALGYWILFRRKGNSNDGHWSGGRWQDGVMVGLGHGGIEAMGFIGVLTAASVTSLWALRGSDLSTLGLPSDQLAVLTMQMERLMSAPLLIFVPLLERVLAISLHVALSLLIWFTFKRRNPIFLFFAITYHALVDGTLVMVGQFIENALILEAIFGILIIPGLLWAWRSRPEGYASRPHRYRSGADQLALFAIGINKELRYQWRTKRILIVTAVFLLFGLGSPLLAKFTPELLRMIEGAEQFADLIPTPTNVDAMEQYIKNITQFGFIIAILMGMGAVAGEKEKGTAAMILSKPMPRWVFIVSKFVAQTVVYCVGFLIAALGAFYYTMILFDAFAFGPFMFANLLLLLWVLVFTAVTLLGSTIARTTSAAAGVALIGSVILLLAGSFPKIGVFAPSGLVAWAGQLGPNVEVSANGGALVANLVIIVVCLITAVAVLETQEI